jgi:hypothetical protein
MLAEDTPNALAACAAAHVSRLDVGAHVPGRAEDELATSAGDRGGSSPASMFLREQEKTRRDRRYVALVPTHGRR